MLNSFSGTQLPEEKPLQPLGNISRLPRQVMESHQFIKILVAIMNGKYSWACVLILDWANYRPQDYVPYRTYTRLIQKNRLAQD